MNSAYISISPSFNCMPISVLESSLPKLPDNIFRQLAILEHRRNEELISIKNLNPNDVSSSECAFLWVNDDDAAKMLKSAQRSIVMDMTDIDPEIREYIDANFLDLIWK